MQRGRNVVAAIMVALFTLGLLGTPAALAQTPVAVWMDVATANPAYGCWVPTNVSVQSGGAPLAGASVTVTLSNDADAAIISTQSGATDGNGVAYLGFDTTNAPSDKAWLEVAVNGQYIGGRTIWPGGGACDGAPSTLDLSGSVPSITDSNAAPASVPATSGTILPNVVTYTQQRNLSCEYAAISIATGMIGGWIDEYDMEQLTGWSENPHWGYRGNINGLWGNTDDYGVYADALIPGLNARGFQGHSFYGNPEDLMASINAGRPTLVWLGMKGQTSFDAYTADGTRYQLTPGMHVMTAYGYDQNGVYLSDPANGSLVYYDWGTFNAMWQVMDGMALGVSW